MNNRIIGWFGKPGDYESRSTKTHVIYNGELLCGSKINEEKQFQFCAFLSKSNVDYIECEHCLAKVQKT